MYIVLEHNKLYNNYNLCFFIIESSATSDYVSFNVVDRTIEEGKQDTAMICLNMSMTNQELNGSISISDIGNAGVDSVFYYRKCGYVHVSWVTIISYIRTYTTN